MTKQVIKSIFLIVVFFAMTVVYARQPSKIVAECTISYTVSMPDDSNKEPTTKKLYIKGRKTRSEIQTLSFDEATIFDSKTGTATILKEIGGDKYISQFSAEQWKAKNVRWNNVKVELTGETKKILNYNCRKAVATLTDGTGYIAYYTEDMVPSATENPFQFKNIPGLILQYESRNAEGKNIQFKATDIDFSPVPAEKFTLPKSGYRII